MEKHEGCSNGHLFPVMDRKQSSDALLIEPGRSKSFHATVLKYRKLKFTFICMLTLNALLLIVVSICMVMIVPNIKVENKDSPKTYRHKDEHSAHVKCLMIQQKLHKLYKNGQMMDKVKDDEKCSMEDLLDSFTKYINDSMHKQTSNQSAAFHMVSNNTHTDRCKDSRTLHCLKNWRLSMNTSTIDVKDEAIVVPSSGAYFLYSRVVIEAELNKKLPDMEVITHLIRYSNTGERFEDLEKSSIKCGVIKNTMSHISYIEKIQYLEKGSQIKVALNYPRGVEMQDSVSAGAFGMFRL